jgi:hypothetical protein
MLDRHPQVAIAGKFEFLIDAISADGRFMKRDAFVRSLSLNGIFQRSGLTIAPGLNFTGIAHDFLDQIAAIKNAAIRGATVHQHFDRLLWLWPDARFIHLVRDGRDVALSTLPTGRAGTVWRGIRWWVEAEHLWERMEHKLPIERQLTVHYEKLTSEPERELRRICQFLGVAFSPELLRYDASEVHATPVGKWRDADPADVAAAEYEGARWLLQHGYVLSGRVRPPSLFRATLLRLQDRYRIARYRRNLFGKRLWGRSLYVSRFGSRKAKARLALEMKAVTEGEPGHDRR